MEAATVFSLGLITNKTKIKRHIPISVCIAVQTQTTLHGHLINIRFNLHTVINVKDDNDSLYNSLDLYIRITHCG